jgi:Mn-dependent DtxR family transcriptional regulator
MMILKKIEANFDLLEGYLVKYYGLQQDEAKAEAEKFYNNNEKVLSINYMLIKKAEEELLNLNN